MTVPDINTSVPSRSSTSSSVSSSSKKSVTNTLVLTGLPPAFFRHEVLEALHDHFASFGELFAWAPLSTFARIIVVYLIEGDAERAKLTCDGISIEATSESPETIIRVYRADPTPIDPPPQSSSSTPTGTVTSEPKYSPHHLRPPALEKNYLISPPGSPPVGWEPVKEEPPNQTPLADDLIMALRKLQFSREHEHHGSSLSVLIKPEEGPGVGVYVQDCDGEDAMDENGEETEEEEWRRKGAGAHDEAWYYGSSPGQQRFAASHTMRPPMPSSL